MEGQIWSERRHLERFSLKATAIVRAVSAGTEKVFELSTKDISSGGAFFPMEVPLPNGEKVRITLYLSISPIGDFPSNTKITTGGESRPVLRQAGTGSVATRFVESYVLRTRIVSRRRLLASQSRILKVSSLIRLTGRPSLVRRRFSPDSSMSSTSSITFLSSSMTRIEPVLISFPTNPCP